MMNDHFLYQSSPPTTFSSAGPYSCSFMARFSNTIPGTSQWGRDTFLGLHFSMVSICFGIFKPSYPQQAPSSPPAMQALVSVSPFLLRMPLMLAQNVVVFNNSWNAKVKATLTQPAFLWAGSSLSRMASSSVDFSISPIHSMNSFPSFEAYTAGLISSLANRNASMFLFSSSGFRSKKHKARLQNPLTKDTTSCECTRIVYSLTAASKSLGLSRQHQMDMGVMAIRVPLLCEAEDDSLAAFLQRQPWCSFILQAFGIDFRMVLPTSMGFDRNQFPISSAMQFMFNLPFPRISPFPTEQASSESSVGCPGSNLCMPPPLILKAELIFSSSIRLLNSKYAPMTSPNTAPHNDPLMKAMLSLVSSFIMDLLQYEIGRDYYL